MAVYGAVDHNVTDAFRAEFLWLWREPDERIDLSPAQEPHRLV
jgi:hypothetical protein